MFWFANHLVFAFRAFVGALSTAAMPYSVLQDPLLLDALSWREIEDIYFLTSELEQPEPPCYTSQYGLLDIASIRRVKFVELFRFRRDDIDELRTLLRVPDEVMSAQRVRVSGMEALCMTLRRLAYPNRLCELEMQFGRHGTVVSSVVNKVLAHIEYYFAHLLSDMTSHQWMNPSRLQEFAEVRIHCVCARRGLLINGRLFQAVHARGAPLGSCWGFIDGTARRICRPTVDQQEYFSGHKRCHVVKYQAVMCANGMICQLNGPYKGRRHDAGKIIATITRLNVFMQCAYVWKGPGVCCGEVVILNRSPIDSAVLANKSEVERNQKHSR